MANRKKTVSVPQLTETDIVEGDSGERILELLNQVLSVVKIDENTKISLGELFKLVSMREELMDKGPSEVTVRWIDNQDEESDEFDET